MLEVVATASSRSTPAIAECEHKFHDCPPPRVLRSVPKTGGQINQMSILLALVVTSGFVGFAIGLGRGVLTGRVSSVVEGVQLAVLEIEP